MTLGGAIGYAEAEQLIEQLQAVGSTLNTKTFDQKVNDGSFTSYVGASGGLGTSTGRPPTTAGRLRAIVKIVGTNYQVVEPFCCTSFKVG